MLAPAQLLINRTEVENAVLEFIDGQAWVTLLGSPTPFQDIFKLELVVHAAGTGPCLVGIDNDVNREFGFGVYPNPIESTSKIGFQVSQASNVKVAVYDMYGRMIKLVAEERVSSGLHEYALREEELASGMYFVKLSINDGEHEVVRKIIR